MWVEEAAEALGSLLTATRASRAATELLAARLLQLAECITDIGPRTAALEAVWTAVLAADLADQAAYLTATLGNPDALLGTAETPSPLSSALLAKALAAVSAGAGGTASLAALTGGDVLPEPSALQQGARVAATFPVELLQTMLEQLQRRCLAVEASLGAQPFDSPDELLLRLSTALLGLDLLEGELRKGAASSSHARYGAARGVGARTLLEPPPCLSFAATRRNCCESPAMAPCLPAWFGSLDSVRRLAARGRDQQHPKGSEAAAGAVARCQALLVAALKRFKPAPPGCRERLLLVAARTGALEPAVFEPLVAALRVLVEDASRAPVSAGQILPFFDPSETPAGRRDCQLLRVKA